MYILTEGHLRGPISSGSYIFRCPHRALERVVKIDHPYVYAFEHNLGQGMLVEIF